MLVCTGNFIPQRSERSGSSILVPILSECLESKVKYPAPWGGKGGKASVFQGWPWGIDTLHFGMQVTLVRKQSTGIHKNPLH
jgi:hypothetical protein